MKIPAGAKVTQAIKAWAPGSVPPVWGSAALDTIVAGDIRFVGTDQPHPGRADAGAVASGLLPSWWRLGRLRGRARLWEPITIPCAVTAYVDTDGIPAAGGTISPGGKLFEAIATLPTRAYVFTMDGNLDRAVFDAFLATIQLRPAEAIDTPPLTETFKSPLFGYSVKTLPEWTTAAAEKAWTGVTNDSAMMDGVDFTGTDRSRLDLAAAGRPDVRRVRRRLPRRPEGARTGRLRRRGPVDLARGPGRRPRRPPGELCNAAEVLVEVGGRVYLFEYGNGTFESARHFPFVAWKDVLKSITFTPETAK